MPHIEISLDYILITENELKKTLEQQSSARKADFKFINFYESDSRKLILTLLLKLIFTIILTIKLIPTHLLSYL